MCSWTTSGQSSRLMLRLEAICQASSQAGLRAKSRFENNSTKPASHSKRAENRPFKPASTSDLLVSRPACALMCCSRSTNTALSSDLHVCNLQARGQLPLAAAKVELCFPKAVKCDVLALYPGLVCETPLGLKIDLQTKRLGDKCGALHECMLLLLWL